MSASVLAQTKDRCPELAEFLEDVCDQPFNFDGPHPIDHSFHNHTHLWALEWWAEHHAWIDQGYRTAFVEEIFARWTARLKGFAPYRGAGYRLYVYQDLAPTVSVVADTPEGCPYDVGLQFVPTVRDVMKTYVGRKWSHNFESDVRQLGPQHVLQVIEANAGSISKPAAQALGLQVGHLRILIERMGLDREVNQIRKRFRRRPAKFRDEREIPFNAAIHERILPAGYR